MKCSSVCCMAAIESYVTLVSFFLWRRCRRIVPLLFSMSGSSKSKRWHVFCQDLTKWIALCSPCQAASSSSVGMKKLRELKEFVAVEGKDRLDSELEGLSRDVLRQVSQAADLPVKVSGQTLTASELRHALLGVLIPSEEQEEAGWGEM